MRWECSRQYPLTEGSRRLSRHRMHAAPLCLYRPRLCFAAPQLGAYSMPTAARSAAMSPWRCRVFGAKYSLVFDDAKTMGAVIPAALSCSGLVDAPECPAGHAIVVRNHLSDLRPLIEHGPCPTDVPIQMANLQMPLGSKHSGHFVDALRLGEEFFQGGLRLFLNVRNVARDFEGDLLRHEDSQAGARFGHLEQGEPGVDVTRRDALAGDVANHIEHRARVHAQHRQPQPHQARYFLRTQTHERDWSYCSRRLRANS